MITAAPRPASRPPDRGHPNDPTSHRAHFLDGCRPDSAGDLHGSS